MFWIALLTIGLVVCIVVAAFDGWEWYDGTTGVVFAIWGTCFAIILFIGLMISGSAYGDYNNAKNSVHLLERKSEQRDILLETFQGAVTNEDFVLLMQASTPEDILFLSTRPNVDNFLLGRANRLIDLNGDVFKLENNIISDMKSVCNMRDNPIMPRIPFLYPDCNWELIEPYMGGES